MAEPTILAHSSSHFEDLQLSTQSFYEECEKRLEFFQYPNLSVYRTKFKERGMLSANREYLCIERDHNLFYICAAPFGRSFFVSWWLRHRMSTVAALLELIPFFGKAWARNYEKKTFFESDTEDMFRESIRRIVDGLVDKLKVDKGFLNKD